MLNIDTNTKSVKNAIFIRLPIKHNIKSIKKGYFIVCNIFSVLKYLKGI